jgi:HAD superfamily phosphatase (TIGR01668 family)
MILLQPLCIISENLKGNFCSLMSVDVKNKDLLVPTEKFAKFSDILPETLKKYNIKGVLVDLDDTLVTHNCPVPGDNVTEWLDILRKNGYYVCIVSNNHKRRTTAFAEKLDIGFFYNSFKPAKFNILKALQVLNIKPEEAVLIGDQLFTDVKAAKLCGLKAFLVDPVGNKATLFIKFKREIEKKLNDKKNI